jgi:hypothetical protein
LLGTKRDSTRLDIPLRSPLSLKRGMETSPDGDGRASKVPKLSAGDDATINLSQRLADMISSGGVNPETLLRMLQASGNQPSPGNLNYLLCCR